MAFVKKRAALAPSGVRIGATCAPVKLPDRTMRCLMSIWKKSAVISRLDIGCQTAPPLRFFEVSGRSGCAPRPFAMGLSTGGVQTSKGATFPLESRRKFVLTVENHDWPREGARKPVLAAALKMSG